LAARIQSGGGDRGRNRPEHGNPVVSKVSPTHTAYPTTVTTVSCGTAGKRSWGIPRCSGRKSCGKTDSACGRCHDDGQHRERGVPDAAGGRCSRGRGWDSGAAIIPDRRFMARAPRMQKTTAAQTCSITETGRFDGAIYRVNLIPNWLATAFGSGGATRDRKHGGISR
jgi:hypothetical protein